MSGSDTTYELSDCTINLPTVVDIVSAEALFNDLNHASHAHKIIIHAEKVERITTPAVQLLLATEKSLSAVEGSFVIQSPSEVFQTALIDLGLGLQLKKWSGA